MHGWEGGGKEAESHRIAPHHTAGLCTSVCTLPAVGGRRSTGMIPSLLAVLVESAVSVCGRTAWVHTGQLHSVVVTSDGHT